MKLSALIPEANVETSLEAESLEEVIARLIDKLAPSLKEGSAQEIKQAILAREEQAPSTIINETTLLHLRSGLVEKFGISVAMLKAPIIHPGAPDEIVRIVFLILAPQDQNTLMLQTLAAIARLYESKSFLDSLRSVKHPNRFIRLIEESGMDVKRTLTARDVMEPVQACVGIDTPLHEALRVLIASKDEGVPVIDNKGKLAGELTSKEVLLLGMPKYMDLLVNPEMLNAFEAFENFFSNEATAKVRDICRRDFVSVAPGDPIVRVAHEMITRNRRRVFVLADGRIEGIIYRKSIVEKVLCR